MIELSLLVKETPDLHISATSKVELIGSKSYFFKLDLPIVFFLFWFINFSYSIYWSIDESILHYKGLSNEYYYKNYGVFIGVYKNYGDFIFGVY